MYKRTNPVFLHSSRQAAGKPGSLGRLAPVTSLPNRAYLGGAFVSAGGGVELMAPFGGGGVLSEGGMVVVVPGEVD